MAVRTDRPPHLRHLLAAVAMCAVLLSGCNIGCAFAPCDVSFDVLAKVKDPSGAPVPDVEITVFRHSDKTDRNGCLELGGVTSPASLFHAGLPDVELRAEKPGYKSFQGDKPFSVFIIDVTLQPTSAPNPSSAVWTPYTSDSPLSCG